MLSAWRKLTKKQDERPVFPSGVAPIDHTMQKKYAKGVQYNMKIILKGDRNTGKTTLFHRLTGGKFKEEYIPTQEIQVANVNWNYRGADDIVKVEVWDIVDKSKKKRTLSDSLKITNVEEVKEVDPTSGMALDAEFINVYKGTHGVVLTMDITKAWTWQYVQRELEKIPNHIPVLVLANFRDIGEHRVVPTDEIIAYVEHLDRPTGSAEVYFSESSMKDGFGLCFIYKFLNMPFLILQRETLLKQLEANTLEIEDTRESLTIDTTSEDHNYGLFQEMLIKKVDPAVPENNLNNPSFDGNKRIDDTTSPSPEPSQPSHKDGKQEPALKQLPVATVSPTVHAVEQPKPSRFQAYKAKLFGNDDVSHKEAPVRISPDSGNIVPIDDFNPGQLDDSFLSGRSSKQSKQVKQIHSKNIDSDSDDDDDEGGNPMVAGYEDLESDDEKVFQQQLSVEAEFDDLSDDERPQIKESKTSIIEKVKASKKKKQEQNNDVHVDGITVCTQELDITDLSEYAELDDSGSEKHDSTNKTNTDNLHISLDSKDLKVKRKNIMEENIKTVEKDEESDDESENVYVVTRDLDVDEAWMNNNDSGNDGHNEDEDNVDDVTNYKVEDDLDVTDSKEIRATSLNFDLDALEMFMTNQMQKKSVSNEPSNITPEETSKPKKKKKKKVAEAEEATTERRKKKKTKKEGESSEKGTTTKTRKPKKTSEGSSTSSENKSKKSSAKKTPPKSEFEAFFD